MELVTSQETKIPEGTILTSGVCEVTVGPVTLRIQVLDVAHAHASQFLLTPDEYEAVLRERQA